MAELVLPAGRADCERAIAFLSALPKDRAWRVAVTPWKKSRSDAQNRALFGLAYNGWVELGMTCRGETSPGKAGCGEARPGPVRPARVMYGMARLGWAG